MSRQGRAIVRVDAPNGLPAHGRIELAGDGTVRLRILPASATPVGPPAGALSYSGTWHAGRWSGSATIVLTPVTSTTHDLEVALEAPASRQGKLLWPANRLRIVAERLALALRDEAERTAPSTDGRSVGRSRRATFRSPGSLGTASR